MLLLPLPMSPPYMYVDQRRRYTEVWGGGGGKGGVRLKVGQSGTVTFRENLPVAVAAAAALLLLLLYCYR